MGESQDTTPLGFRVAFFVPSHRAPAMHSSRSSLSRFRAAAVGVAALSVVAACGSDTSTAPTQDDATRAVGVFTQLADSIARAGGDSGVGGAYASLAEAVRQGGRVSTIVITVDGVPTTFMATAQRTEILFAPCAGPGCDAVIRLVTLRTLIAWQQDDPRRVVQVSSESDADPIRAYLFPVLVPFAGNSASLTFFDDKGGMYFGTSGSQKFGVKISDTPCVTAGASKPIIAIFPAPARCTQADFSITFDGKVEPSSFLASRNTATGSHTFAMSLQQVLGARFQLSAFVPPRPPIIVLPSVSLPATITARTDSVVTLTLTVSNPSSTPAHVVFNSGQRFDFTISSASTGAVLWSWGVDKLFAQAFGTETVPANGALVYTAQWKPTVRGNLIAAGSLASVSHHAGASISINVP